MSDEELRGTYRILDASANRAGEGLRSLEEFARFVLDDPQATSALKSLRHQLASAIGKFPRAMLLAARDTEHDVGTEISERTELSRQSVHDVVAAASARTGQSLRVLEEYGKTIDAGIAAKIEQLRYRFYTLSGSLELSLPRRDRQRRVANAHLYALIDGGVNEPEFAQTVGSLIESGVDVIQLRDRKLDDRTLIARAKIGTAVARQAGGLFIVNDRADLTLASDADGVHVGQEELPARVARSIVGPEKLIGISTHSLDQAQAAVAEGADYIGCGPVFAGRTKSFDSYVGTSFLNEVAESIHIPAFAIGGIDLSNVNQVIAAGIQRIAVTGALRDADNPLAVAKELKCVLSGSSLRR